VGVSQRLIGAGAAMSRCCGFDHSAWKFAVALRVGRVGRFARSVGLHPSSLGWIVNKKNIRDKSSAKDWEIFGPHAWGPKIFGLFKWSRV
jgi:hypothetical protein